jgi:hypothetical protein
MSGMRRRQGTASVEIVIMLPIFLALLFAVTYLHGLGSAFQSAAMAARACAWSYALQGCQGKVDSTCSQIPLGRPEGLRISLPGSEIELKASGEVDFDGSWFDAIAEMPLLGPAVKSVFGVGKRIKATRSYPKYMAKGNDTTTASTYVLCNVVAETWSNKVGDLLARVRDCNPKRDALCKD